MTAIEEIAQAKQHLKNNEFNAFWEIMSKFYESHNTAYYRDIIMLKFWWKNHIRSINMGILGSENKKQVQYYLLFKAKEILKYLEKEQLSLPNENLAEILATLKNMRTQIANAKLVKFAKLFSQAHSRYKKAYMNYLYERNQHIELQYKGFYKTQETNILANIISKIEIEKKLVLNADTKKDFFQKIIVKETLLAFKTGNIKSGFLTLAEIYLNNYPKEKVNAKELQKIMALNYQIEKINKDQNMGMLLFDSYLKQMNDCFEIGFDILEESASIKELECEW